MCAVSLLVAPNPAKGVEVILGAVGTLWLLAQPFLAVPIMFLLGPLGDLQHFETGLSFVKVVIVLAICGLGAQFARRRLPERKCGLAVPLAVFVLVFCSLSARNVHDVGQITGLVTTAAYPSAFFLVLYLVTTPRRLNLVLACFAIGTFLTSVACILEEYAGYNPLVELRGFQPIDVASVGSHMVRSLGLAQDPNAAAYPLLLAIPLFVALDFGARTLRMRLLLFIVVCTSVFGLAITFSRSAYIGTAVGLLFLLCAVPARKSVRVIAAVCVLLFLLLHAIPEQALWARFQLLPREVDTQSDRLVQYEMGMRQLLQNPLTGGGTDLFLEEMTRYFADPTMPHSNPVTIAVSSGLLGLAATCWLLVVYCKFVWRGIAGMPWTPLKYCAIGSSSGLLAFMTQGFFIANMGWFMLWAMAAVPVSCIFIAAPPDAAFVMRKKLGTPLC